MAESSEEYNLGTLEGQQVFFRDFGWDKLGKYGLVAFASRAALRVMPFLEEEGNFKYWLDNRISLNLQAIDRCLFWSIRYSCGKKENPTIDFNIASKDVADAIEAGKEANVQAKSPIFASAYSVDVASTASYLDYNGANSKAQEAARAAAGDNTVILHSQREDILWLQKKGSEKGVSDEFYKRDLWENNKKPEGWKKIESNFQAALKEIGLSDMWENYQSRGLRYLEMDKKPTYVTEDREKKETPSKPIRYKDPIIPSSNRDQTNPVLGVNEQVKIMGEVLKKMEDDKGQFVGLFGRWGRGKTFFWEQLWKYFEGIYETKKWLKYFKIKVKKNPFIKVEFHAWKYQDTPASWAYLYQKLSDAYLGKSIQFWSYYPKLIALNIYRGAWKKPLWGLLLGVGAFLFSYYLGLGRFWSAIVGASPFFLAIIDQTLRKEFSTRARELFQQATKRVSFEGYLGAQAEIQDELVKLLKIWTWKGNKRILLFIDDIDRCEEQKLIAIVDSIRVMLENDEISQRMIVLAAVDERILKLAIANKYRKVVQDNNSKLLATLSREYMDKLFIAGIKLNRLPDDKLKEVMDAITKLNDVEKRLVNPDDLPGVTSNSSTQVADQSGEATKKGNAKTDAQSAQKANQLDTDKRKNDDSTSNDERTNFLLEKAEYEVFLSYLPDFVEATPRTMHIYLYRYTLGIRLLKTIVGELPLDNTMKDVDSYFSLLSRLIVHYSSKGTTEDMLIDVEKIRKDANENVHFDFIYHGTPIPKLIAPKKRLLDVYTVLEMVVAY